jgi:hypothetical protein
MESCRRSGPGRTVSRDSADSGEVRHSSPKGLVGLDQGVIAKSNSAVNFSERLREIGAAPLWR